MFSVPCPLSNCPTVKLLIIIQEDKAFTLLGSTLPTRPPRMSWVLGMVTVAAMAMEVARINS